MKPILITALSIFTFLTACGAKTHRLAVGDKAPAFTLTDQNGHTFNSTEYLGKKVLIVYFYPKDESPVCTKEACAFRDSYAAFEQAGALVVGVNSAAPATHKKFAEHYSLPFVLLSDPDNRVLQMFGVKSKFTISGRETFVVGKDGKIAFMYNSLINGSAHAAETLRFLKGQ